MNWNHPVSVEGSVRCLGTSKTRASWTGAVILIFAAAIILAAGAAFHPASTVSASAAKATKSAGRRPFSSVEISKAIAKSISIPLFFEPNQGQTDPQVKFLARGRGYGLFLTANEAVLEIQHATASAQPAIPGSRFAAPSSQPVSSSVIRMRLDGANSSARVSGASPLPGKSNYFIGSDPSKWRNNIPQFARVQYDGVYPGIDLVYYGNQGQLEYDFRVSPGADPNQIALDFSGASARIVPADVPQNQLATSDSGVAGDLIISTANGDVRFHAPRIYQPATGSDSASRHSEKTVAGSFRQLAGNKIGFAIGDYDHSRELVIDPTLSYSTYIGGNGGNEGFVQVAVDSDLNIYVAGSTTSASFPTSVAATNNPNNPPYQAALGASGAQNIFIAVLNPTLAPPQSSDSAQLTYATYLGGTQTETDTLAGLAVDSAQGIYVAGTTTSTDFPTTSSAFQPGPLTGTQVGAHGFLSKISNVSVSPTLVYGLSYSTYLAGNGADAVTGLAIDSSCGVQSCNAYVTGNTTSSDAEGVGFPANANGYQILSNSPGNPQFFASKINTNGNGQQSMLYSTYFGGGYPSPAIAVGGGIAVDPSGNMYITGTTNMLPVAGPNPGEVPFPLLDAQQPCLNQGSTTTTCLSDSPTTDTDAFVAKFNPNYIGTSSLIYSTYLGGNFVDTGNAIAVDSTGNAYVTGSTYSTNWVSNGTEFQTNGYGGNGDAYLAKIGSQNGSVYPLTYFTYLGGPGTDVGNAIAVNSIGTAYVAGSTSGGFTAINPIQPASTDPDVNAGVGGDAFVASISTTSGGTDQNPDGDFFTYLGGGELDQGTGIALDIYGAAYVAGTTLSTDFPLSANPFQNTLNANSTDAFVSKLGAFSRLTVTNSTASPAPSPASAGVQVAFTFIITNNGPDPATSVNFYGSVMPNTGLASLTSSPTGKVTSSAGSCSTAEGSSEIIPCTIPTLAAGATASVELDATPNDTTSPVASLITASGTATANGGGAPAQSPAQTVQVVDYTASATTPTPIVSAGETATIVATFCPSNQNLGYSATITPSDTILPSMVTASTPTFNPTTVTLSGSACESTTLTIPTVARPVTSGSLLRRGSFYATWLPIGGLSLLGLGLGAKGKRRRWLVGLALCMIAGVILLLPGCGSSSTPTPTPTGTQAGVYNITIVGSAGTGASHNAYVQLRVD